MSSKVPSTSARIADGLSRLARVLRKEAWVGGGERGLTPTMGAILQHLETSATPPRLCDVAAALSVRPPTASRAVQSLIDRDLVRKRPDAEDARAIALELTLSGRREARRAADWPQIVQSAVASLAIEEQQVLLRALVKIIRHLQLRGVIEARTCAGCAHFRPFVHDSVSAPHHCAFVNTPLGDGELRVDCPDAEPAPTKVAQDIHRRFLAVL